MRRTRRIRTNRADRRSDRPRLRNVGAAASAGRRSGQGARRDPGCHTASASERSYPRPWRSVAGALGRLARACAGLATLLPETTEAVALDVRVRCLLIVTESANPGTHLQCDKLADAGVPIVTDLVAARHGLTAALCLAAPGARLAVKPWQPSSAVFRSTVFTLPARWRPAYPWPLLSIRAAA